MRPNRGIVSYLLWGITQRRYDMCTRITTSASVFGWTLSRDRNDHQCTELVVIHARMSNLAFVNKDIQRN